MIQTDLQPRAFDATEPRDPLEAAMASRDGDVMGMVRQALAEGNAQLAFQPVVAAHSHLPAFHEGLVRLRDAGGRILPANQFMPWVEETDLGREIDCAALGLGLDMLQQNPRLRLSLNMSARSVGDRKWRQILDERLHGDRRIGERLILEISEGSAMNLHEVVIRFMAELQPIGVSFALDDFGGGLISFRLLKDFYFDLVKIDAGYTRGIEASPDNQVLAEALITVAHQFEMFVVAPGVESAAEVEMLQSLGVDCLQGYHFGVPKFTL